MPYSYVVKGLHAHNGSIDHGRRYWTLLSDDYTGHIIRTVTHMQEIRALTFNKYMEAWYWTISWYVFLNGCCCSHALCVLTSDISIILKILSVCRYACCVREDYYLEIWMYSVRVSIIYLFDPQHDIRNMNIFSRRWTLLPTNIVIKLSSSAAMSETNCLKYLPR